MATKKITLHPYGDVTTDLYPKTTSSQIADLGQNSCSVVSKEQFNQHLLNTLRKYTYTSTTTFADLFALIGTNMFVLEGKGLATFASGTEITVSVSNGFYHAIVNLPETLISGIFVPENFYGTTFVQVSSTGTATDTISYITVDGVEKRIAGAGAVDKATGAYKVYINDGEGTQTTTTWDFNANGYTFAVRGANGVLKVGTPSDNSDATTKEYVDVVKATANSALQPNDVVDNLTSTSTNKPLSAKQGKILNDRLENVEGLGRFMSVWNATTGQPSDLPDGEQTTTKQYNYRTGDWFKVGTAGSKFPVGANIPIGTTIATFPSETRQGVVADINDTIIYTNNSWVLIHTAEKTVTFGSVAGSPYDNTNLGGALNDKQNQIAYSLDEPVGAENGDVWGYEGIDTSDVAIGNGLEITETSGGTRVLGIDSDITATKTDLTSKLDKNTETGSNRVYGINKNGEQTTYIISQEVISERIIQRDSGGRAKVATPVENDDITNKQYVDEGLGSKANTADLSTVATSGSYDDLDDKPHLYRHFIGIRFNTGSYDVIHISLNIINSSATQINTFELLRSNANAILYSSFDGYDDDDDEAFGIITQIGLQFIDVCYNKEGSSATQYVSYSSSSIRTITDSVITIF